MPHRMERHKYPGAMHAKLLEHVLKDYRQSNPKEIIAGAVIEVASNTTALNL